MEISFRNIRISFRMRNWYKFKKVTDRYGKYMCIGPILIQWVETQFYDWKDISG